MFTRADGLSLNFQVFFRVWGRSRVIPEKKRRPFVFLGDGKDYEKGDIPQVIRDSAKDISSVWDKNYEFLCDCHK